MSEKLFERPLAGVTLALVWALMMLCAPCASGVSPYPELESKAQRAFNHQEWASASALLDLMLDERPQVADTYGQAIVVNAMRGDTVAEMRLMSKALDNHIPFDSVFSRVRQWSFLLGKTHLFEKFLTNVRDTHPWMKRTINSYLLKYYSFRRNGSEMVNYSNIMLTGAPDNVGFLTTLADGYMLTGNFPAAVEAYERVLGVEPRNYHALLTLGNWFALQPDGAGKEMALKYLTEANSVRPTPYVTSQLKALSHTPKKR